MISINNINKYYGKYHVLKDISLEIPDGEVVLISGPNGSGKTTLIKLMLGMVYAKKGKILFDRADISESYEYRNKIGYMPQEPNYPENLTGREILKICGELRLNGKSDIKSNPSGSNYINDLIAKLDLGQHIEKSFKSLSGGNKQKINVLQAFAYNPGYFILDEPTVSLDPASRIVLKELIRQKKSEGKTVIIVTHILSEMFDLTDKFIYITDGRLIFDGSTNDLFAKTDTNDLDTAITKISVGYEG